MDFEVVEDQGFHTTRGARIGFAGTSSMLCLKHAARGQDGSRIVVVLDVESVSPSPGSGASQEKTHTATRSSEFVGDSLVLVRWDDLSAPWKCRKIAWEAVDRRHCSDTTLPSKWRTLVEESEGSMQQVVLVCRNSDVVLTADLPHPGSWTEVSSFDH